MAKAKSPKKIPVKPVRPKEGSPDTIEDITFVITGVLTSMSRDEVRRGRKIYTGARGYIMHSLVQSLTTQFVPPPLPLLHRPKPTP